MLWTGLELPKPLVPEGGDMAAEDRFEHALENLYKAALADVKWVSTAALINDMIGTNGHSLTYAGSGSGG